VPLAVVVPLASCVVARLSGPEPVELVAAIPVLFFFWLNEVR
jgi:hypothetical protein